MNTDYFPGFSRQGSAKGPQGRKLRKARLPASGGKRDTRARSHSTGSEITSSSGSLETLMELGSSLDN